MKNFKTNSPLFFFIIVKRFQLDNFKRGVRTQGTLPYSNILILGRPKPSNNISRVIWTNFDFGRFKLYIAFLDIDRKLTKYHTNDETSSLRMIIFFSSQHVYIIQKLEFQFDISNVQSYQTLSKLAHDTLLVQMQI